MLTISSPAGSADRRGCGPRLSHVMMTHQIRARSRSAQERACYLNDTSVPAMDKLG